MDTKTSLKDLIENHEPLSINDQNILGLARIKDIWQLITLAQWKEIEWINNKKVLNEDTIALAKYILNKTVEILGYDPLEIRDRDVFPIAMKLWESLVKSKTTENFVIWTYIQKIAYQIKTIHLRYERFNKHLKNTELELDSSRDHLTWLYNRKSMDLFMDVAIANKKRHGENYWVILLDIDFFKAINDTYWHDVWDVVLQELSLELRNFFREEDRIARWWGEEFLILMKWWELKDHYKKMEKLRKELENNLVDIVNKKIKIYSCKWKCNKENCDCIETIKGRKITISAWISCLGPDDTKLSVVKRADDLLYLAKWNWRNRIIIKEEKKEEKITMN